MPIHEFACDKCETEFELLMRHDTVAVCPACQGKKLTKLFSVPAAPQGSGDLPICSDAPMPSGGCGADACRSGCQFD